MPRQANGNYILPAGNPVESNTLITPSWANPTMSDIGNALSDSLSRSGLGGMTAELLLDDGLVNIPGLGFTLEANTGFYRPASRVLAVAVNGNGVVSIRESEFIYGNASAPGTRQIVINSALASGAYFTLQQAGLPRWFMGHNGAAGPADVWELVNHDGAGAFIDRPIQVGSDPLGAVAVNRSLFVTGSIRGLNLIATGPFGSNNGLGFTPFIDKITATVGRFGNFNSDTASWGNLAIAPGGNPSASQGITIFGTTDFIGSATDRVQVHGNVHAAGAVLTSQQFISTAFAGTFGLFDLTNGLGRIGTYKLPENVWLPLVVGGGNTAGKVLIGTGALLPSGVPGAASLQVAGGIAAAAPMSAGQEGGAIIAADDAAVKFVQIGYSDSEDTGIIKVLHSGTSTKPLSLNPLGGANGPVRINTVAQVGDGVAQLQVLGSVSAQGYLQSQGNLAGLSLGQRDLSAGLWSLYVPAGAFLIDTPEQNNALNLNPTGGLSLYGTTAALTLFHRDASVGSWSLYSQAGDLQFYNGTDRVVFGAAGGLQVNGQLAFASASLPATTLTFTNAAGTQTATLTNSPLAGNPTKWIQIDDNGTIRRIPAW